MGGNACWGIWNTSIGGNAWNSLSNGLPVLGVSGICIEPFNTNIIYILTGYGDGGNTKSVGVLKTTNGGLTWNTTGLSFTVLQSIRGYKLMMSPTNSNLLYAATSDGLYKSDNAASTWTKVLTGNARDAEFKPGNTSTVYCAVGTVVKYSTNSGSTWSNAIGIPGNNIARIAIAVSPAAPNRVYALLGQASKIGGFRGFYVSNNSGANFSFKSNSPAILGYEENGSNGDSSAQCGYDLALAVHTTNPSIVMVGGINIWRSVDTGATWTLSAHWVQNATDTNYVHADIHDLKFTDNDNVLYACSDGGIFKSLNNGSTWFDISAGLNISQYYSIDINQSNNNFVMAGAQDNGCNYINVGANTNLHVKGADGMQVAIQPSNNNVIYYSWQEGGMFRSDSGGADALEHYISPPGSGNGAFFTPFIMDKQNESRLYAGYRKIFRTNNKGDSWAAITDSLSGKVSRLALSTNNNQLMLCVINSSSVLRTTNALAALPTFTAVTDTDIVWPISNVVFSERNADQALLTMGGFNANKKVVYSNNGGVTWTPINTGLPNVPVNCAAFHPAYNNYLFVGTDVGVYMYDLNTGGPWVAYNNGLPNVIVRDLKVYAATNTLVAGTFSRGLWRTPLPRVCPSNLFLDNTSTSSAAEYWHASNGVESSDNMTWGNGAAVTYKANDFIQINPGFFVGNSMTFNANIEPCANNNLLMKQTGTLEGPMVPEYTSDTRKTYAEDSRDLQVYPVPVDEAFTIRFVIEEPSDVTVSVYDVKGNFIKSILMNEKLDRGVYSQDVSALELSKGIYLVRLLKNSEVITKRITKM
ncbi:MAG: T9SS type A sorting domain-containing protein [Bacteroidetes bacterium]|nr:T9SS type A sorting domain-containing protein [Bacteroidota bacterium]